MENQKMAELFQEIDEKLKNVFQLRTFPMREQNEQSRMEVVGSLLYLYNDSWTVDNANVIIGVPSSTSADIFKKPSVIKKFSKWLTLAELGHLIPEGSSITNSKKFPQLVTSLMDKVERRHGTAALGAKIRTVVQKETRKIISGGTQCKVKTADQRTTNTSFTSEVGDPSQTDESLSPKERIIPTGKQLPRTPSSQEQASAQGASLEKDPAPGHQTISMTEDLECPAIFQPVKQLPRTPTKNISMSSNRSLESTLNESTKERLGSFYSPTPLKKVRTRRQPIVSASEFSLSPSVIIQNQEDHPKDINISGNKDLQSPSLSNQVTSLAPNGSTQAAISTSELDGLNVELTPRSNAPPVGKQLARTPVSTHVTQPTNSQDVTTPIQDQGSSEVETVGNDTETETIILSVPNTRDQVETETVQIVNSLTRSVEGSVASGEHYNGTPKASITSTGKQLSPTIVSTQISLPVTNGEDNKFSHKDEAIQCRSQTENKTHKADDPGKVLTESEEALASVLQKSALSNENCAGPETLNGNVEETPRRSVPTCGKQLSRTPFLATKPLDQIEIVKENIRGEVIGAAESIEGSTGFDSELALRKNQELYKIPNGKVDVDSTLKKAKNIIPTGNQIPNTPDHRLLQCIGDKHEDEDASKAPVLSTKIKDQEMEIEAEIKRKEEETERLRKKLARLKRIEEEKRLIEEEIRKLATQDEGGEDLVPVSNDKRQEKVLKQTQEMQKKEGSVLQTKVLDAKEIMKDAEIGKINSERLVNKNEIMMEESSQKEGGIVEILDDLKHKVNNCESKDLDKQNGIGPRIVQQNVELKSNTIQESKTEKREDGNKQLVPCSVMVDSKFSGLGGKESEAEIGIIEIVGTEAEIISKELKSNKVSDEKVNNKENCLYPTGELSKTYNVTALLEEVNQSELEKQETNNESKPKETESTKSGNGSKIKGNESKKNVKELLNKNQDLEIQSKSKTPLKEIGNKKRVQDTSSVFETKESEKLKPKEKLDRKLNKLGNGASGGKSIECDKEGNNEISKMDEKGRPVKLVAKEKNDLNKIDTQSGASKKIGSPAVSRCDRVSERKEIINETIKRGQEKKEERKKVMEQFEEKRNVKKKIRIGRKPAAPVVLKEVIKSDKSSTPIRDSAQKNPGLEESFTESKLPNTANVNQNHCDINVDETSESWQITENVGVEKSKNTAGTDKSFKCNEANNADDLTANSNEQLAVTRISAIIGPCAEISDGDVENRENLSSVKNTQNKKLPARNTKQKRESILNISEASPAKKLSLSRADQSSSVTDSSRPLRTSRSRKTVNYCETKPVSPVVKKVPAKSTPNKVKTVGPNTNNSEEAVAANKKKVPKKNVIGTPKEKCPPEKTIVSSDTTSSQSTPNYVKPKTSSRLSKVKSDSAADKAGAKRTCTGSKRSSTGLSNDVSSPKQPNMKASTADDIGRPKKSSRASIPRSAVTGTKKKETHEALEEIDNSGHESTKVQPKAARGKTQNNEGEDSANGARKRISNKQAPLKKIKEKVMLELNVDEDKLSDKESSELPTKRPTRNAKKKFLTLEGLAGSCSDATPSPHHLPAKEVKSKASATSKRTTSKKSEANLPVKSNADIVDTTVKDIRPEIDQECVSSIEPFVEHVKDATNSSENEVSKEASGRTKSKAKISSEGADTNVEGKQTRKRKQNRPRRSIGGVLQDIDDAVYKTPDTSKDIPDEFYVTPKAQGVFGAVMDEEYLTPTLPSTNQPKKRSTRSTRNK